VFVDPDGFLGDPTYDLGVVLRDWCPELLAAHAPSLAHRYCRQIAARTGMDPAAIWDWGFPRARLNRAVRALPQSG
jgi:streptomycin 6-kinase